MLDVASVPDLLRLLVIPFFGYVAWRDIATRRVPNRTWIPLATLAIVLFAWETYAILTGDVASWERQHYYIQVAISLGFIIPLSYLFWLIGGFGGADAKAFFIIAVLFPTYPDYHLGALGVEGTLAAVPIVQTTIGVFSLTILSNTVLAGVAYPVVLAGKNALTGYVSPGMFVAKPVRTENLLTEYGMILDFPDGSITGYLSLSGLRSYFNWRQLDLDALRMYLQWRNLTLEELRGDPAQYRDPDSLPAETKPPGDGSFVTDGGEELDEASNEGQTEAEDVKTAPGTNTEKQSAAESASPESFDDPWGAEEFLDDIDGSAYGTTPEGLREGLDRISSEEVLWISPGIPFLVPLFVGLILSFTYGDLLFALLSWLGLA